MSPETPVNLSSELEREKGIEPSLSAWEADVLPLNHSRFEKSLPFGVPARQAVDARGAEPGGWRTHRPREAGIAGSLRAIGYS